MFNIDCQVEGNSLGFRNTSKRKNTMNYYVALDISLRSVHLCVVD